MFDWSAVLFLAGLGLVAALWRACLAAREAALATVARCCRAHGVQLLDQALVIAELGLRRDGAGRLRVWRMYEFEFSSGGEGRHPGRVGLLGDRVETVQFDGPEGTLIEGRGRVV
jgi:hypothetical protein